LNLKRVYLALPVAFIFWFILFFEPIAIHLNFWLGMLIAATNLILISFFADKNGFKTNFQFQWKWIPIGLISAGILYGIFFAGNFFSNLLFDFAKHQVDNIYTIKEDSNLLNISLLLFILIGPAEEIFWRGYIQKNIEERYGENKAFISTAIIYALVHIWSFNFMLIMAAFICGLFWGWMYKKYKNIIPGIISHSVWDVVIFSIFPIM